MHQQIPPDEFEVVEGENWDAGVVSVSNRNLNNLIDNLDYTGNNIFSSNIIPKKLNNNTVNSTSITNSVCTHKDNMRFADNFHFSTAQLDSFNNYKMVFKNMFSEPLNKYINEINEKGATTAYSTVFHMGHVPSLFNPYLSVNIRGIGKNVPLYNKIKDNEFSVTCSYLNPKGSVKWDTPDNEKRNVKTKKDGKQTYEEYELVVKKFKYDKNSKDNFSTYDIKVTESDYENDFTDCSINTLVKLSNEFIPDDLNGKDKTFISKLGVARYKYADFMYCKDLGRISNNHLITLRRFAIPVGDNIISQFPGALLTPDIGRMVCWLGEDNKLEEILKYTYKSSWKQLNSEIQQKDSQEDSADRGILGSMVNMANPQYLKEVASGAAGSGNRILNALVNETPLGAFMDNKGTYEGNAALGNYDQNKIYTPKNSIQDTHIYEGKLTFTHSFNLVFKYELRAYENINPRAAFLDLLGNIHSVTYNRGEFWGGEQKVVGAPGNEQGWKKANYIMDNAFDKIGGFFDGLLNGGFNLDSIFGAFGELFGSLKNKAEEVVNDVTGGAGVNKTGAKNALNKFRSSGMGNALRGMVKNKLGRPAMYGFNSLLDGSPVGVWHVMIGNPRAPILSMGNLIIENTQIEHNGPLGIDDFPTQLTVTVTLKHAKSRDMVEIQKMYTGGVSSIANSTIGSIGRMEHYYDLGGIMSVTEGTQLYEGVTGGGVKQNSSTPITYKTVYYGADGKEITDFTSIDNHHLLPLFGTNNPNILATNFSKDITSP
jgi:hypothetical protein